ncbi:MAG: beta-ketoacyl-ACP synthase III [Acidimicrobiia bacterium]
MTSGLRISGLGTALPPKVVTNADLETTLDTNDAWIVDRTGIRQRHVGGSTAQLAAEAARQALDRAGADPDSIDLLILCTCTPDETLPATASVVQADLGLSCGAFDLNAACSGWTYGLVAADGFLRGGMRRILLVGAETLSRIVDWDDRGTAILFGDAAAAAVVEPVEDPGAPGRIRGYDLGSDGRLRHILHADVGGTMLMDGPEVFRRAVRAVVDTSRTALARAGVTAEDLRLVVPHQANIRIIESACAKLGIPMERNVITLDRTGNTSAASIPFALAEAVDQGRVAPGDLVLLVGFGAGMTWAAVVLEWGP